MVSQPRIELVFFDLIVVSLAQVGGREAGVVHRSLEGDRLRPHDPEIVARGTALKGGGGETTDQRIRGVGSTSPSTRQEGESGAGAEGN